MFRVLASVILKLMGWKTTPVGSFPVQPKKYVLIVAPHTSGWDFIIGVMYRSVLRLTKSRYLGKAELFRPPFGFFFRWLGGTPVDRSTSQNMVDQVAQLFDQHDELAVALSPEGTRQRVDRLRTGFYNIAKKANVPIVMVGFDFKNKQVIFSDPFYPSEDQQQDFNNILRFLGPVEGKHADKGLKHLIPA
ncbi:MAG: 1-acyl-sn-glycerol-3-phosphate acyltransferase [Cyclobacteriaceae bacterium]|nr:1-acyl-sn-glycerol-3-phosphate acyltransferase [Cyclobacteriaceae bacterium]